MGQIRDYIDEKHLPADNLLEECGEFYRKFKNLKMNSTFEEFYNITLEGDQEVNIIWQ